MAKGYPDYFGVSIFPYYGPLKSVSLEGTLDPASIVTIPLVTGKGHILFLEIAATGSDAWDDAIFSPTIDTYGMGGLKTKDFITGDSAVHDLGMAVLETYDEISKLLIARLLLGVPFGVSVSVAIENEDAVNSLDYAVKLWYNDYVAG